MSGGAISTIWMSLGVIFSRASIFLKNRKSTAKRLGIAIRLPVSCLKVRYGESLLTMMTAPERCPSDTIFTWTFLSARSMTGGPTIYAAWMRPAIKDSLTSGHPLYLLYWNSKRGWPTGRALLLRAFETHATGSVRLQVTGNPPTTKGAPWVFPFDPFPQESRHKGKAAAIR